MQKIKLLAAATVACASLAACGGGEQPATLAEAPVEPAPAPSPTPSPSPSPTMTPTPSPTPTPAPTGDGRVVVVTEGDSIAQTWRESHTGLYRDSRNDIEFFARAVGGSKLTDLNARLDDLLELRPDLVSVHVGANDLTSYNSAQAYAEALRAYVEEIRASGARVVVTTVLPQQTGRPGNLIHNSMRKELRRIILDAEWIDGIADFANDPEMGPDDAARDISLYYDGVHPTDSTSVVGESGHEKLFRIFKPAMDELVADVR